MNCTPYPGFLTNRHSFAPMVSGSFFPCGRVGGLTIFVPKYTSPLVQSGIKFDTDEPDSIHDNTTPGNQRRRAH